MASEVQRRRPAHAGSGSRRRDRRANHTGGLVSSAPRDTRQLLAHIVDTPHLARAVPRLPPQVLHHVIESCGLEDCAELVALATPEQLSAVFDLDLWHSARPGTEEKFDAGRFGVWLDVLAESGADAAARTLAAIDASVVSSALAEFVSVFDPAVFLPSAQIDDEMTVDTAIDGPRCELGGYLVVAKRSDSWDTIVAVLGALDAAHNDRFHSVMRGCRTLSNSKPEADGFYELLTDSEQAGFNLALDRERRRERQGYVTPEQSRAFLQASRELRLDQQYPPPPNPIAIACVRAVEWASDVDTATESGRVAESGDPASSDDAASVVAVVNVLLDAGVLPDRPRALLTGGREQPHLGPIQEHMEFLHDHDPAAYVLRGQELAFLANVLVAGCSIQARSFTTLEAFDAAVAVCNLGLESWPPVWLAEESRGRDFLAGHDLATVFQVGWAVLHRDVCMLAAERLLDVLRGLHCRDREVQLGLHQLRRELTRHWRSGMPWRARDALDVITMLDMPAWAALLGLIAECPVLLANVRASGPSRPLSISAADFQFVSSRGHIALVREFMQALPDKLSQ